MVNRQSSIVNGTGTREWSTASANCRLGCSHGCLYCYARADALRWKRIASASQWTRERNLPPPKKFRKRPGVVMFPTTHDITPANLDHCLAMLEGLLKAGNQVLIVTKPHASCIAEICRRLRAYGGVGAIADQERIEFRFSIGAVSPDALAFWEPGAPDLEERMAALWIAHGVGFATSVSCEPLLEPERAVELVASVEPHVTETIWIGKANRLLARTDWCYEDADGQVCIPTLEAEIERIEAWQTPEACRRVYEALKGNPKVRWKDSYRLAFYRKSISLGCAACGQGKGPPWRRS